MTLSTVWFFLIGGLFAGYAVLDGFDLGAGAVHLFVARNDTERRSVMNAIGPVWDGNEVWLITAGGALFAAFPLVYATVFSGFYLAMLLVLAALIVRAVSIEFRSKETNRLWRNAWDVAFGVSSALAVLLFGVALGNILRGLPLDTVAGLPVDPSASLGAAPLAYTDALAYRGGLVGLLNPFSLAVGVLTLGLAVQQGSAWLVLKTEGALQARARRAQVIGFIVVVVALIGAAGIAAFDAGRIFDNFVRSPLAWIGPIVVVHSLAFMSEAIHGHRDGRAFLYSCEAVLGLAITAGAALYPNLVPAVDTAKSLTVDNAHSSDLTMTVMMVVALIGMPIVIAYTSFIYWKFKGKVRLEEASY